MNTSKLFALSLMIVLFGLSSAGATALSVTLTSNVSSTNFYNQPILLTATVSGGSGNYNYNYFVNGKSITSTTSSSSNAIVYQNDVAYPGYPSYGIPGLATFSVTVSNTVGSGSATTNVNIGSENSIIVGVTPTSASVDNGQTLQITANPNGGTPPYSLQVFSGSSSTCSLDTTPITGIQSSTTFNVFPNNNGVNGTTVYYCVQATDSKGYSNYSNPTLSVILTPTVFKPLPSGVYVNVFDVSPVIGVFAPPETLYHW